MLSVSFLLVVYCLILLIPCSDNADDWEVEVTHVSFHKRIFHLSIGLRV